jgi:HK97 gp10 family phage protein
VTVSVQIQVQGLKEIEQALKALGVAAANRVARSALNRAANPVVARAKELAPQRGDPDDPYATGLLAKSITKRLRRQRPNTTVQVCIVGVQGERARIAHLVELGTAFQPAEPYLRPAIDETHTEVLHTMRDGFLLGINREVEKLARNTKRSA